MPAPPNPPCLLCGATARTEASPGPACGVCFWPVGDIPDFDLEAPRVDVVYYLRFRDRVKIGTSRRPRHRLAAIRHDELLAFEPGDRILERTRHSQFADLRLDKSEWFTLAPPLTDHIVELRRALGEPWQSYARMVSARLLRRGTD